ncbi:unknown protein [Seminavis robusta]|uniref:Uncharacterized protein n=1 Tax=Seminavis robusta TaxID=568900 RepID=A0A9N8DIE6_9STRA|nr:unknown protein [Seminavis robusta]|eukprot:Sro169_g074970.1 n/a (105) ;mRNA; f:8795-9109
MTNNSGHNDTAAAATTERRWLTATAAWVLIDLIALGEALSINLQFATTKGSIMTCTEMSINTIHFATFRPKPFLFDPIFVAQGSMAELAHMDVQHWMGFPLLSR